MTYSTITNAEVAAGAPLSTALMTALRDNAEYARIGYVDVSGTATPDLDLVQGQFFDGGPLTADITLSFSNVLTEAAWSFFSVVDYANVLDASEITTVGELNIQTLTGLTDPRSGTISPDGTVFTGHDIATDVFFELILSTPWDLTTAVYSSVTISSVALVGVSPNLMHWSTDGTKFYCEDDNIIHELSASTPFDITTFSTSDTFTPSEGIPENFCLSKDGLHLFTQVRATLTVYAYTMSTAFDLTTISYSGNSFDYTALGEQPDGIGVSEDGTKMGLYVSPSTVFRSAEFFEYTLSTPFDPSTASLVDSNNVGNSSTSVVFALDGAYSVETNNDATRIRSYFTMPSITLPAAVQNLPEGTLVAGNPIKYDFASVDGGTTVYLIGEFLL